MALRRACDYTAVNVDVSLVAVSREKFILHAVVEGTDNHGSLIGGYTLDVLFPDKFLADGHFVCECGHCCNSDDDGQISHF
jgi:hypothetical protein